jgi:hypothetical protein
MKPIQIKMFIAGSEPSAQAMLDHWIAAAGEFNLACETELFDIFKQPALAREFGIVATPTTVIDFGSGRVLRWVGFSDEIELLIRTLGQRSTISKMREEAESMAKAAGIMYRSAAVMLNEVKQMRDDLTIPKSGHRPGRRCARKNGADITNHYEPAATNAARKEARNEEEIERKQH